MSALTITDASGLAHLTIRRGGRAAVIAARDAAKLLRVRREVEFEHLVARVNELRETLANAESDWRATEMDLIRYDAEIAAYDAALATPETSS